MTNQGLGCVGMLERLVPEALERSPWVRTTNHWASETAGSFPRLSNNPLINNVKKPFYFV